MPNLQTSDLLSVATIIASLVAVSGIVYAAQKSLLQVRKNNVMAARIVWLQTFKERIANVLTDCFTVLEALEKAQPELALQKRINIQKGYTMTILTLNSVEPLHNQLVDLLKTMLRELDLLNRPISDTERIKAIENTNLLIDNITIVSKQILKSEWEVTKSGQIHFYDKSGRKKLSKRVDLHQPASYGPTI